MSAERARESMCQRDRECVQSVSVCVREKESVCVRERESVCFRERNRDKAQRNKRKRLEN